MGHIKLVTGLLMTACFTLSIVLFIANFGIDNNSAILLTDDDDFQTLNSSLQSNLKAFIIDSNSSADTLFKTTQEDGDQSASSGGQFKVGASTALSLVTSFLTIAFTKIFGEDTGFGIFLTAITSILLWMVGLYIWKSWKGNPD